MVFLTLFYQFFIRFFTETRHFYHKSQFLRKNENFTTNRYYNNIGNSCPKSKILSKSKFLTKV